MFQRILSQPVSRLMVLGMLIVAILPVGLMAVHLNKTAWENSWREINEKHKLLAQNLAAPIEIYVDDHFNTLYLVSESIKTLHAKPVAIQEHLDRIFDKLSGFGSISYVNVSGQMLAYKVADDIDFVREAITPRLYGSEHCYLFIKQTERQYISGIKPSPFTLKPSIIMGVPIFDVAHKLQGVLLAEIRISVIEKLRLGIKFGDKGHSAIVDQNGRVIAHPNTEWMQEMKNLSSWPIVQKMKAGKTGVTEFYSSFMQEEMVAGYSAVTGTGWGVMVPQPKSEVVAHVNQFMNSNYLWGGFGLLIAIILGFLVSQWITRPINRLAEASQSLLDNNLKGELEFPADSEPREARQLGYALKSLVRGLQFAREEVGELNGNLQEKVGQATQQLRIANEKLEETAKSDFLTSLGNRRYFEMDLTDIISRKDSESDYLSLLLFDIDNFKVINDTYGHAAGDEVLTHVARILESFMRQGDVVARYAGDEFVLRLCCDGRVAQSRANQIRHAIENLSIPWRHKALAVTVSIGVYSEAITADLNLKTILHNVDIAMYEAKKRGRNCVKAYRRDMSSSQHKEVGELV